MYAKQLAAYYWKRVDGQLQGFFYRAIKQLLRIKGNVDMKRLFQVTLGMSYQEYSTGT